MNEHKKDLFRKRGKKDLHPWKVDVDTGCGFLCHNSPECITFQCLFKADLHYGDYRSKLVHFETHKKIFSMFEKAIA
jgi:hypothetical protein